MAKSRASGSAASRAKTKAKAKAKPKATTRGSRNRRPAAAQPLTVDGAARGVDGESSDADFFGSDIESFGTSLGSFPPLSRTSSDGNAFQDEEPMALSTPETMQQILLSEHGMGQGTPNSSTPTQGTGQQAGSDTEYTLEALVSALPTPPMRNRSRAEGRSEPPTRAVAKMLVRAGDNRGLDPVDCCSAFKKMQREPQQWLFEHSLAYASHSSNRNGLGCEGHYDPPDAALRHGLEGSASPGFLSKSPFSLNAGSRLILSRGRDWAKLREINNVNWSRCEHRDQERPLDEDLEEEIVSPTRAKRSRDSGWADEAELDTPDERTNEGAGEPASGSTERPMLVAAQSEALAATIDSSSSPELIKDRKRAEWTTCVDACKRSKSLLTWHPIRNDTLAPGIATIDASETHWSEDKDYANDNWHIISSGCSTRLLMVKAQQKSCCHYLINIYQKVHDGSKDGSALRGTVWDALQQAISTCPTRHSLVIAGDFNTGLQACAPYTGSAIISKGNAADAPDAHVLQRMLKQFDLRALNTFQPTPGQTKGGAFRQSQIDFIIIRGRRTDSQAKCTRTLVDADLGAWRGGPKHWPVQASIPAECYYASDMPSRHNAAKSINAKIKQGQLHLGDPEGFQQAIQQRLQSLRGWDTQEINGILEEELHSRLVPVDLRTEYDTPDATTPVKSLWRCHRELKALQQVDNAEAEIQRRDLKIQFNQLQRQVRAVSKLKRQAFVEHCIQRATQAAQHGDIREVYLQVNKIAPKVIRRRPQLRDAQGHIMSTLQETQALQRFWQEVHVGQHPRSPDPLLRYDLPPQLLEDALASLPQHKSLPDHYVPGIAWKLAASSVAALAHRTILSDWQMDRFWIPPEWRHAWLCFILKPNKSGRKAEEYRPIGLTDPVGKALLGAISVQHRQALYESVAPFPQFAYMANRGVSQALMRAFQHLHIARELVAQQRVTLQQRHAGATRCRLVGAITVSLDMSKAFDSLEPKYMHQALELISCLPSDVCRLIEHWHADVVYHFEHEKCQAHIRCGRGIRQGCKIAPRVWSLFTILVMHEIGPDWCKQHSNWFADDALFQAVIRSEGELLQHIKAISKALWVLQKLGMSIASIAASKSAVLLHLGGTTAGRVKAKIVQVHNQKQQVLFQYEDQQWRLPVVAQHDYLGATLSYTRMEDLTATRRIKAAQALFDRLKPVLTQKALALKNRLRIWQACVTSSLLYALPQVGLTSGSAQRVAVSFYRQLRHITSKPVHLTGVSNQQLCGQYDLQDPIDCLLRSAQKQQAKTVRLSTLLDAKDARLSEDILACEARVLAQIHTIASDRQAGHVPNALSTFQCPECDHVAGSKAALTKHRNKIHQAGLKASSYLDWKEVDRFTHGANGLPTCRWCGKDFSSWQQLQRHIFDQVCQTRAHVVQTAQIASATPMDVSASMCHPPCHESCATDAEQPVQTALTTDQPGTFVSPRQPDPGPMSYDLGDAPEPHIANDASSKRRLDPQPVHRDNAIVDAIKAHPPLEVLFQLMFLKELGAQQVLSEGGFEVNNPNKRYRQDPDQDYSWGSYQDTRYRSSGSLDVEAAVYALAKLCLRQETELSEIRQEKCFLLHVSAAPHGILKPLIQASMKWNELRDQMKVECSLKTELFRLMLKETAARMEKFERNQDSQRAAEKVNWISGMPLLWLYQKWDPEQQQLVLDQSRSGIPHQEVKDMLENLSAALKMDPESLNQFAAKRRLTPTMTGSSVPFRVSIGLRGPQCQILYEAFLKPSGLAVLNLIGANMHKERQRHGREADEVGMPPGLLGTLGTSVRDLAHTTQPVLLRALPRIQAIMRLWNDPNKQHDVAEFLSHLITQCRMPFGLECWQVRAIRGLELRILDEGSLCTPIPLPTPVPPNNGQALTFQDCAAQFFRGSEHPDQMCALASVAPLVCFQLRRYEFDVDTGITHKCTTPVGFSEHAIQVPVWSEADTVQIRHVPYRITAIAFHEGVTPTAGHYRTCLLHQGQFYVTDVGAMAQRVGSQMLERVQSNSYLFICTLCMDG
ncbi:pol [Symbiodinium sp. CCMP2456]|nr:pol [Symbiodinium sp. CCMP2456]